MVQPLRDRKVYFYDPEKSCFPIKKQKKAAPEQNYHFEKITKNVNKYFNPMGFTPSGIKGALVVGQTEADMLEEALPRVTDRYEIHF